MRQIETSDLLPVIYNYLKSIGLKSFSEKLQKMSGLDLEQSESPLASKKLAKIVKFYVKNNEKLLKKFEEEVEEEESQSVIEEAEEEDEEESIEKPKKSKKNKKQKKQESEDEEEEETPKIKNKNKRKNSKTQEENLQKKVKIQKNDEQQQEEDDDEEQEELGTGAKFFQKCDESRMATLKEELKDNTFEAKQKFGQGGDEHGRFGYDRLKDKRGKDFKKEKNKLKAKAFCGGSTIDPNAFNGIKL